MISARFKTDCTRCHGLCCTVFAHLPVNGFPVDKPADTPCLHLTSDHRCAVFETLEDEGFTVCRHYDCFGAGPMVTRWMNADRPDASVRGRHEDFRQLGRLHMLITNLAAHDTTAAKGLIARLDQVSQAFEQTGLMQMDEETPTRLRENEALVLSVLDRVTGGGGVGGGGVGDHAS